MDSGWEIKENKFGNPKIKKADFIIDLVAMDNVHSIKDRGLEPSIDNYLSGTPLTIQSIAFDIDKNKILGEAGIKSIFSKTVEINNKTEYDYTASIYGDLYSPDHYAEVLGFKEI